MVRGVQKILSGRVGKRSFRIGEGFGLAEWWWRGL